jgi:hypothetical protein
MSDASVAAPAAAPSAAPAAPAADLAAQANEALQTQDSAVEGDALPASDHSGAPASAELKAEAKEAVKDAVASMKKKFNIKVDGKQLEREIDLGNEAELIKIIQMAEMAQSRAQEAANLRKSDLERSQQVEDFINALKNDPRSVLEHLGHNVPELANKVLEEEIKKMEMSPEQRKIQELEAQLKAKLEAEETTKKQAEAQAQEALKAKYAAEYEKDMITALDSGNLPRDPEVITRLTGMMKIALANKIDLSFADLIPLLKENMEKQMKAMMSAMSAEDLDRILAEEKLKEINSRRRKAADALKPKQAPPVAQSIKDSSIPKAEDLKKIDKKINAKDFFRNLGKK